MTQAVGAGGDVEVDAAQDPVGAEGQVDVARRDGDAADAVAPSRRR